jgi:hypothetical protein
MPSELPSVLLSGMPELGNGADFSIGMSGDAARGALPLVLVRWSDVVASSRPNF